MTRTGFDYSPDDMPRLEDVAGVCATDENAAFWFPEDFAYSAHAKATEYAKAGCQRCDLRDKCLTVALRANERYGIWGGLTASARQKLARRNAA